MKNQMFDAGRTYHRISRLVVAPHANDEAFGCGGLLAKHRDDTAVVVLARLDEDRSLEFKASQHALGYLESFFLSLPHGQVGQDMRRLAGMLDNVVNATRPMEMYLPFPSIDQDHVAAYQAGMRLARLSGTHGQWFPPKVLVYDVAARDVSQYPADLRWNACESLNENEMDRKLAAVLAYRSQTAQGPHLVQAIKQCAHTVGSARHMQWAEQYALVRSTRDIEVSPPTASVHRWMATPDVLGGIR